MNSRVTSLGALSLVPDHPSPTPTGTKKKIVVLDCLYQSFASSTHEISEDERSWPELSLRLREASHTALSRARPARKPADLLRDLELKLQRFSEKGELRDIIVYYGVRSDPFHPFDQRFDLSMKVLKLFERYTPGLLVVQTRSPLIVIGLSSLKALGTRVIVTYGIETCDEALAARYTPELPTVQERLRAASALRNFGVEVMLQVSPLLPYGDLVGDVSRFAEILDAHASLISIHPLHDHCGDRSRRDAADTVARKIAADGRFEWLRPESAEILIDAVQARAPEKLATPIRRHLKDRQLSILVA